MTTPRRGPLARPGLSLAVLVAFLILVGLGVWQVRRLQWKEALLADIAAAQSAPAQPLAEALAAVRRGEDVGFRRVIGNCPGLDETLYVRLHAIEAGVAGHRYISRCLLKDAPYPAILVDRGFLPNDAPRPGEMRVGGRVPRPVVGFLRAPEPPGALTPAPDLGSNLFYGRDPDAMAAALGGPAVAPVFLMLESPPPAGYGPRPAPTPTAIPNNHLGYALTWFGLAAALLGVYGAMMFKRPTAATPSAPAPE